MLHEEAEAEVEKAAAAANDESNNADAADSTAISTSQTVATVNMSMSKFCKKYTERAYRKKPTDFYNYHAEISFMSLLTVIHFTKKSEIYSIKYYRKFWHK